jgi:predicted alpha/beta-fold hydrolase
MGEVMMENIILEWNGDKVSYFVDGDSKNPTIVCLHGLAGSAYYSFSELSKKNRNTPLKERCERGYYY